MAHAAIHFWCLQGCSADSIRRRRRAMAGVDGAGWACAQCTLINVERRRSCEACGRRRAKAPAECSPTSGTSPDGSGAPQPLRVARRGAAAGSTSPADTLPASAAPASDGADGSLGYASRLTFRADLGGQLGAPELSETDRSRADKVRELAALIASASHLVVFTGAGISTSIGIPDFRGPDGVWTCQRRGAPMPKASMPFSQARSLPPLSGTHTHTHHLFRFAPPCTSCRIQLPLHFQTIPP